MADRIVTTRWTGGMRAVSDVNGFEIVVDEPETHGGTNTGPQPTDLLLASIASCIVLSMAFVARKRGIELLDLDVTRRRQLQRPQVRAHRSIDQLGHPS